MVRPYRQNSGAPKSIRGGRPKSASERSKKFEFQNGQKIIPDFSEKLGRPSRQQDYFQHRSGGERPDPAIIGHSGED